MPSNETATEAFQLIVIAKAPIAGRVKTRLCPPLSPQQAADLALASLLDTLDAARASEAARTTLVLDGVPGSWLPAGIPVLRQRSGGLDRRLAGAFSDVAALDPRPMLLVGMDTPQLSPELINASGARLATPGTDAVLGLACDGGWWGLGLHRSNPALLTDVPMSSDRTGAEQLRRLVEAGLRVASLPVLMDVDLIDDAQRVAIAIPHSGFASALAGIGYAA